LTVRDEVTSYLGSVDSSDWVRWLDYCRWWHTLWQIEWVQPPDTDSEHTD